MKPVIVISGDMGFGGIVTAVLATCAFLTVLVLSIGLLSAPAWGLFYAYRIGKDYGPKTRKRVVAYFMNGEQGTLDLERLTVEALREDRFAPVRSASRPRYASGERNMNLEQYRQDLLSEAEKFINWWHQQNQKDPEAFPMEMPAGEWDEQFRAWQQAD